VKNNIRLKTILKVTLAMMSQMKYELADPFLFST